MKSIKNHVNRLPMTNDGALLLTQLPGAKKRKTTRRNDLMEAVNDGRGPNKKH